MKKLLVLIFTLAFIGLVGCGTETGPEEQEPSGFIVETDFEYQYEKDGHYRHVVMPKIAAGVVNGDQINERLRQYNSLEELKDTETWGNPPEGSFKRYYVVSRQDGICGLYLILEYLREGGNGAVAEDYHVNFVESFYYDESTQQVLSQEEYLAALGYTEADILNLFNAEYGEKYKNRTYEFRHIIFWFDEENNLHFSTYNIDQMDSNTADFALIINGNPYSTGIREPKDTPFGEALKSEEKFHGDVWAGSWWVEEHYDGAYVLYALNKETGERFPFHVEVTKANKDASFDVYTYRGATIGDTRSKILELYPEIDPTEQKLRYDTENLLALEGAGGYLYLKFHFKDGVVAEMESGTIID